MLTFDEPSHTYRHGGDLVPSVTQILGMMTDLSCIRESILEYAKTRGHGVHLGCELYDQDDLDWDSVGAELRPYIDAWADFRAKTGFVPIQIEQRVFHPHLRYAGTLDRSGIFQGELSIIDIKAVASMYPTTGMQTAAYAEAIHAGDPKAPKHTGRYAVQLLRTGKWKLHTYRDRTDWPVFVSALTLMNWAHRNNHKVAYEPAVKERA